MSRQVSSDKIRQVPGTERNLSIKKQAISLDFFHLSVYFTIKRQYSLYEITINKTEWDGVTMADKKNMKVPSKELNIGANVSLNGLVTAVFDNMVHVQIGAKIVTVHVKDLYSGLNQSLLKNQQA